MKFLVNCDTIRANMQIFYVHFSAIHLSCKHFTKFSRTICIAEFAARVIFWTFPQAQRTRATKNFDDLSSRTVSARSIHHSCRQTFLKTKLFLWMTSSTFKWIFKSRAFIGKFLSRRPLLLKILSNRHRSSFKQRSVSSRWVSIIS